MMKISKTQTGLIRAFLMPSTDKKQIEKGLSSLDLKKRGINRKTFDNHLASLLNQGIVRISHYEEHGIQKWNYYQLTQMGVLTYFQYAEDSEIKKIMKSRKELFPILSQYWEMISRLYGVYSGSILKGVLRYYDIDTKYYGGEKTGLEVPVYINPISKLTLHFHEFDVVFSKEVGFDPYKEANQEIDMEANYKKFEETISHDLTFATFFYMLNLPFNSEETSNIWWEHHVIFQNKKLKIRGETGDHLKSLNKFAEKTRQNSIKILNIIKKDEELKKLFLNYFSFINEKFKKPKIFTDIEIELCNH